jgi:hypothetical protein
MLGLHNTYNMIPRKNSKNVFGFTQKMGFGSSFFHRVRRWAKNLGFMGQAWEIIKFKNSWM